MARSFYQYRERLTFGTMLLMPDDAAYVEHCIATFLDVMEETHGLVGAGETGAKLADVLHHASDLLDIISDELRKLDAANVTLPDLSPLRAKLDAARALLPPGTLH